MRAELPPLTGKYYGTKVLIEDEELGLGREVVIWFPGEEPSDRELGDYTREDWDRNISVPGGWGGDPVPIKQADIIDWSHFESEQSFIFATRLVDAINRGAS